MVNSYARIFIQKIKLNILKAGGIVFILTVMIYLIIFSLGIKIVY